MAERVSRAMPVTPAAATTTTTTTPASNGHTASNGGHLVAPAAPRGPRRSPTTGHVRRRLQSSEPRQTVQDDGQDEEQRSDPRPAATDSSAAGPVTRSRSMPAAEERAGFERISTSEDDDEYWHRYFEIQSKNIAAHNGNSLAAAAAGVLRPGPARERPTGHAADDKPMSENPARERAAAGGDRVRRKTDTTINRKSTAAKASVLSDRRPSAPNFSTVCDDDEVLPPTPKPMLRRRAVRSKSSGPPGPPESPANESASETSSNASKADKSIIWRKWTQAPEPSKKEVLSIDPADVLRGLCDLVPEDAPDAAPSTPTTPIPTLADDDEESWASLSRRSSERTRKERKEPSKADVARKSSLRKERPKTLEQGAKEPRGSSTSRKGSLTNSLETLIPPPEEKKPAAAVKPSWLGRLFGRKAPVEVKAKSKKEAKKVPVQARVNWLAVVRDLRAEWRAFRDGQPAECRRLALRWRRCVASLLLVLLYCGLGGLLFRFIEGTFESFYKCGVKRVKRDFIDALWTSSHNMREDEWKSRARRRLWEFEEQLHAAHEAGVTSYSGIKSWTFLNAVVYCLSVVTTIGYGHISPSTNTGRAATIIYAIFGIPMFLILLADFGKLFTRGIKFIWSFVRRLYYTGSCRQVRRTQPVRSATGIFCAEIMKGAQIVYDLATFRRPSMFPQADGAVDRDVEEADGADAPLQAQGPTIPPGIRREPPDSSEPPATPAPSAFEVDDEFNLPISVAIVILLLYIFVGASIYYIWESWGFFESFYFVFISMSTIGFGDFVPQHPMYMMASIVYLVFGLALTSMCINVVQEKLSDSFRQASAKIGATIGLRIAEQEEQAAANAESAGADQDQDGEDAEREAREPRHGQFLSPNDAREVPS